MLWYVLIYFIRVLRKKGEFGSSLTNPHLSAFLKPGRGSLTSYVMILFMLIKLRSGVIVRFVDVGGIVNHCCLNFLVIRIPL